MASETTRRSLPPVLERPVLALHLKTRSDTNGNPRRLFAVVNCEGEVIGVADEGYRGTRAVEELKRARGWDAFSIPIGSQIEITPRAYRELITSELAKGGES